MAIMTRTARIPPKRKKRSSRLGRFVVTSAAAGSLLVPIPRTSAFRGRDHVAERPDELRELQGEDEFRCRARAEGLEGVQILDHEGLLVDPPRRSCPGGHRRGLAFWRP